MCFQFKQGKKVVYGCSELFNAAQFIKQVRHEHISAKQLKKLKLIYKIFTVGVSANALSLAATVKISA